MERSIRIWSIFISKAVFKTPWFKIREDYVGFPDGRKSRYYTLEGRDLVAILALTDKKDVILVKQYRHGVQKITYDIPGGEVREDETPVQAAHREFLEETGFRADKIQLLGIVYPDSARTNVIKHVFIAGKLRQTQLSKPDTEPEFIEVQFRPFTTILSAMQSNHLKESTLIIAIMMYFLYIIKLTDFGSEISF